MRVLWTHTLPLGEDAPDSSHAPLHWDGDAVLLPISSFEHDRETHAKDPSARGFRIDVHRVDGDGIATQVSFRTNRSLISQSWSFLRLGQTLALHVGSFYALPSAELIADLPNQRQMFRCAWSRSKACELDPSPLTLRELTAYVDADQVAPVRS